MHKKLVGFNIYKNQRTPQIWSISYFLGTFVEKTNEKKKKIKLFKRLASMFLLSCVQSYCEYFVCYLYLKNGVTMNYYMERFPLHLNEKINLHIF